jgi:predicted DNA-binding protein (MmcQ/YjbR family)
MLTRDQVKTYILSKPGAYEDYPFGDDVPVFKVCNKMFGLFNKDDNALRINLKSDPSEALYLRDNFESIIPGYHMNKKHWNTIIIDGSLPDSMIKELIDRSYKLVYSKLRKSERQLLDNK